MRTSAGYLLEHHPDHPEANADGYVRQHRFIMEGVIGRRLVAGEVVHHINGQKDDNRVENLVVMTTGQHAEEHAPQKRWNSEVMREAGRKGAAARWGNR